MNARKTRERENKNNLAIRSSVFVFLEISFYIRSLKTLVFRQCNNRNSFLLSNEK